MPLTQQSGRIAVVDTLRGLASLSVCLFHIVRRPGREVIQFGWLGVYVFFVISGFVVPYSLYRAGYHVRSYHRFIARRMLRLDPPYIFSIALALGVQYLLWKMPHTKGPPLDYTVSQVFLHLAYLNAFFGGGWIQGVYWTLGIEFQYYVIVGLLYPLLVSRSFAAQLALVALCVLAVDRFDFPWDPGQGPLIGRYAFVFLLGVLAFRCKVGLMRPARYAAASTVAAIAAAVVCGPLVAAAALASSLAIVFLKWQPAWLLWLGSISYSLYLTHMLVGARLVEVSLPRVHSFGGLLLLEVGGVLLSLAFAYWMSRYVEAPAVRLATRIRLSVDRIARTETAGAASAPVSTQG